MSKEKDNYFIPQKHQKKGKNNSKAEEKKADKQ
jgi:hypothetical protein